MNVSFPQVHALTLNEETSGSYLWFTSSVGISSREILNKEYF